MTALFLRPTVRAIAIALFAVPIMATRAAEADSSLTNVVALVSQRLALAEPVAHWKWAHGQPIDDTPRERQLLSEVTTRARSAGIDPDFAQAFFQDQIDASKAAQRALFAQWKHVPPTGPAPDLKTVVRPQLDQLTQRLISALVQVEPVRATPDCPLRVTQTLANWKAMTHYDASRSAAMRLALSHVCATGGLGAVG